MNFERQKRLVERLLDKSRAGQMPWEEAPDDDTFQLLLSNSKVQISKFGDARFQKYKIRIADENDITTDVFSDEHLDQGEPRDMRGWKAVMQELYFLARRRSLRADEVIDSILAEIG